MNYRFMEEVVWEVFEASCSFCGCRCITPSHFLYQIIIKQNVCIIKSIEVAKSSWPSVMVDQYNYIDPNKTDGLHLANMIVEKCQVNLKEPLLSKQDYEKIIKIVSTKLVKETDGSIRYYSNSELNEKIKNLYYSINKKINIDWNYEETIVYSLYLYYSYLLLKSMCRIIYGNNVLIKSEHRIKILDYLQNYKENPWVKVGMIMVRIYDKDTQRDDSWIPKNHPYWNENIIKNI